jgi:hypothetical protein
MRGLLLGLLFLLLSPLLCAETPPLITVDQGQLTVLRDQSKQLTLDQARAAHAGGQFTPLAGNLGLGYIPDAVWLRLSITQKQAAARWLEVMPPYLDDVQLFHIRPDGTIDPRRGGDRLPQSAKEEDYRGTLFKLASMKSICACKPPAPWPPSSSCGSPTASSVTCASATSPTASTSA